MPLVGGAGVQAMTLSGVPPGSSMARQAPFATAPGNFPGGAAAPVVVAASGAPPLHGPGVGDHAFASAPANGAGASAARRLPATAPGAAVDGPPGAGLGREDVDIDPEFEEMVSDLRRSFVGWLKRTEAELKQQRGDLRREKEAFDEEKLTVWRQFTAEKQREVQKIREERRRADEEKDASTRQVQADVEEARRRISEERSRAEQDAHQKRRTLMHEYEKFRQEYELFEAERQRIVTPQLAADSTVDLNVGGQNFETARATLVRQPGSYLEGLLSGRHQVSRDRNGRIFINRDPELFRVILNFMRNPQTPPTPRDSAESEALCHEAKFYGIHFFPFPLVFACGGHDGYEYLRAMEVLDVGNQCWRPCRPMATERSYFGAAVLRSRLHLYGGQNLDYKALCDMEVYDCLRDTWEPGAPLTVPRRNSAAAELGGRLYAIGGYDGSQIIASVEAYDARMRNWMMLEPLSTPRSSASACVHGGKLWVLGGTSGTRLKTVDIFDPRAGRWEHLKAEMAETRSALQACCCVSHVFALGGTDNSQNIHFSVECLDMEALVWSSRRSMQVSRMDFACAVISDSIMVGGGQNGEVTSATEFYRPELDEWQPGPSMMFPRYGHQYLQVAL